MRLFKGIIFWLCLAAVSFVSARGQPQRNAKKASAPCEGAIDYWQRFSIVPAGDKVFKLDVQTGEAWLLVEKNGISWVRVHFGIHSVSAEICPRFKIVESRHDASVLSPYDPNVSNPPTPIIDEHMVSVFLIDTETGGTWIYTINGGFFGKPLDDTTPVAK